MADSVRLRILWALLSGERSVTELAELVQAPASTVSRHLSRLRLGRLVKTWRDGNKVYYSLMNGHVSSLVKEAVYHTNHIRSAGRADVDGADTTGDAQWPTPVGV